MKVNEELNALETMGLDPVRFLVIQRIFAATLLMQVLPFYDEGALRALEEFEAAVYGGAPALPAAPAGG